MVFQNCQYLPFGAKGRPIFRDWNVSFRDETTAPCTEVQGLYPVLHVCFHQCRGAPNRCWRNSAGHFRKSWPPVMLIVVDNFILWGPILYWLLETVYYYAQVTVHNWHYWLETRQICNFPFLHAQLSQEFPIWMLEYFGGSPGFEFRCHTWAIWNNIWKKKHLLKKKVLEWWEVQI